MKRSWMGFFLLLALLALSIGATWAMTKIHAPIEFQLQQAARSALAGDWEEAERCSHQAREHWEKWDHFRAALADHTPVEEIDGEFAMLEVYCQTRETIAFAACCKELARKTAAVGEAHELVWENLL